MIPTVKPNPIQRSDDRILAGVCSGIAERLNVGPWGIRLLWILFMLCWGTGVAAYIMAIFSFPNSEKVQEHQAARILGVCWRLSNSLNVDVGILRFLALFVGIGSLGTFLIVYVLLHLILPPPPVTNNTQLTP
jgi:phage shock protein PspC (stress-responsive transcriptional regulator)